MKRLYFNAEIYEADKIIKTGMDIIGEDNNGNVVFAFKGISDFTQFHLEEGQEWDISVEEENAQLKTRLQTAERTAAETSATVQELLELLIDMEVI